jgi:hypothetical protein
MENSCQSGSKLLDSSESLTKWAYFVVTMLVFKVDFLNLDVVVLFFVFVLF